ncbi:hypothetical protein TeGR_g6594 [Tetraparma gracilis]|nr:hypothetical protein TeGR_g6594 [Tetraparma gracilis]
MTYAHAGGPPLNYWHFFPPPNPQLRSLGVIPVWGFGTVSESRSPDVKEGDTYYGFYPMASDYQTLPIKANPHSFTVARSDPALAAVYNTYLNTNTDPFYQSPSLEQPMMIFRPLFLTSFFLDDFLALNGLFGAQRVLLTSASSKTSFALAYMLKRRGVEVLGLTSEGNKKFCEKLGLFSSVVGYDEIDTLDAVDTVVVDMAGSHAVNVALDKVLGQKLVRNIGVGMTHNTVVGGDRSELSEHAVATREFFFAPAWIKKRIGEDRDIVNVAAAEAYAKFVGKSEELRWLDYQVTEGTEKWADVYNVFAGVGGKKVQPSDAHILKP